MSPVVNTMNRTMIGEIDYYSLGVDVFTFSEG